MAMAATPRPSSSFALHMRRQYLPGLSITFVEIGNGQGQNIAKHMAVRQDIMYLD